MSAEAGSVPSSESAEHRNWAAVLLARFRKVDWHRINYILIPQRYSAYARSSAVGAWLGNDVAAGPIPARIGWLAGPLRRLARALLSLTRIGRAAVFVCMVLAVLGVNVGHTQVYVLLCAVAALLVVSFLAARLTPAPQVSARVLMPLRVFRGERLVIEVECARAESGSIPAALALSLPLTPLALPVLTRDELFDDGAAANRARVTMRARQCGIFELGPQSVRAVLPFGLVLGKCLYLACPSVRVVPRPHPVSGLAPALLAAGLERGAPQRGSGADLRGLRKYRGGDSIRSLAARASARAGMPIVREEDVARESALVLVLAPLHRASAAERESVVALAAGFAVAAMRLRKPVQLAYWDAQLCRFAHVRTGGNLDAYLDALAAAVSIEPQVADMEAHALATAYASLTGALRATSATAALVLGVDASDLRVCAAAVSPARATLICIADTPGIAAQRALLQPRTPAETSAQVQYALRELTPAELTRGEFVLSRNAWQQRGL